MFKFISYIFYVSRVRVICCHQRFYFFFCNWASLVFFFFFFSVKLSHASSVGRWLQEIPFVCQDKVYGINNFIFWSFEEEEEGFLVKQIFCEEEKLFWEFLFINSSLFFAISFVLFQSLPSSNFSCNNTIKHGRGKRTYISLNTKRTPYPSIIVFVAGTTMQFNGYLFLSLLNEKRQVIVLCHTCTGMLACVLDKIMHVLSFVISMQVFQSVNIYIYIYKLSRHSATGVTSNFKSGSWTLHRFHFRNLDILNRMFKFVLFSTGEKKKGKNSFWTFALNFIWEIKEGK